LPLAIVAISTRKKPFTTAPPGVTRCVDIATAIYAQSGGDVDVLRRYLQVSCHASWRVCVVCPYQRRFSVRHEIAGRYADTGFSLCGVPQPVSHDRIAAAQGSRIRISMPEKDPK
jgi:hypothetical protein